MPTHSVTATRSAVCVSLMTFESCSETETVRAFRSGNQLVSRRSVPGAHTVFVPKRNTACGGADHHLRRPSLNNHLLSIPRCGEAVARARLQLPHEARRYSRAAKLPTATPRRSGIRWCASLIVLLLTATGFVASPNAAGKDDDSSIRTCGSTSVLTLIRRRRR